MIINQQSLNGIYRSFKVIFNQAFGEAESHHQKIATVIPSTTREENYKWLGKIPRMREWLGERVVKNLAGHGYTVQNKDWESTIAVDRNDIEDDSIGVYNPLVQDMANAAKTHPDDLIFNLLMVGFTNLGYDGQYFFDTDHKDGDGPLQSNKGTEKLSDASYSAAYAQMMAIADENGDPLGIKPNLLAVAPQNREAALKILKAENNANGETNVNRDSAELLIVPRLAKTPNAWFLLDTSKPIKPLIFQQRKQPNFVALDNPDDWNVFMKKEFVYGVDSRDNAGYGLWQQAYGSTGEV